MHGSINVRPDTVEREPRRFYRRNGNGKINNVFSTFGNIRGRAAEINVVKAFAPRWRNRRRYAQVIKQVRLATPFEDNELKYDIVIETFSPKFPRIGVQIKTSSDDYRAFQEKHPDVPVVLLGAFEFDHMATIRKKVMFTILLRNPGLAEEMARLGCQVSPKVLQVIESLDPGVKILLF